MTPGKDYQGLNGSKAKELAERFLTKDIPLDLIHIVQEKKQLTPVEATEWLLAKDDSQLMASLLWRQDKEGGPVRDYTV